MNCHEQMRPGLGIDVLILTCRARPSGLRTLMKDQRRRIQGPWGCAASLLRRQTQNVLRCCQPNSFSTQRDAESECTSSANRNSVGFWWFGFLNIAPQTPIRRAPLAKTACSHKTHTKVGFCPTNP